MSVNFCEHSRVGHVALPYNLLRLNLRLFDFARLEKLLDLTPQNIHLAALLVAQQTEPVDRCADVKADYSTKETRLCDLRSKLSRLIAVQT